MCTLHFDGPLMASNMHNYVPQLLFVTDSQKVSECLVLHGASLIDNGLTMQVHRRRKQFHFRGAERNIHRDRGNLCCMHEY